MSDTLHEILDWFTEPGKGERYLSELEDKINELMISREDLVKAIPEKKELVPDGTEPIETAKRLDDFFKGYNQAIDDLKKNLGIDNG